MLGDYSDYRVNDMTKKVISDLAELGILGTRLLYLKDLENLKPSSADAFQKRLMSNRKFQLDNSDEVIVVNIDNNLSELLQDEISYAKYMLKIPVTYLYGDIDTGEFEDGSPTFNHLNNVPTVNAIQETPEPDEEPVIGKRLRYINKPNVTDAIDIDDIINYIFGT